VECYGSGPWPDGELPESGQTSHEVPALLLNDITGVVQVQVQTALGAQEQRTCDWFAERAMLELTSTAGGTARYAAGPILERTGVVVEPTALGADCYLAGDDWLPQTLHRVRRPRSNPNQYHP